MKNEAVFALIVVLGLSGIVFAQNIVNEEKNPGNVESQVNAAVTNAEVALPTGDEKIIVGNKICPVTGEAIPAGTQTQYAYQGKVYNFCCPMCIETFKADPEKYIKLLPEKEKAAAEAAQAAPTEKKK